MGERAIDARTDIYALGVRDLRDARRRAAVHRPDGPGDRRQGDDRRARPASRRCGRPCRPQSRTPCSPRSQKLPADRFATRGGVRGGTDRWLHLKDRRSLRPRRAAEPGPLAGDQPGARDHLRRAAGPGRLGAPPAIPGRTGAVRYGPARQRGHEFRGHLVQRLLRRAAPEYFDRSGRRLHRICRPPGRLDGTLVSQPAERRRAPTARHPGRHRTADLT